jgi:hypothetical protein
MGRPAKFWQVSVGIAASLRSRVHQGKQPLQELHIIPALAGVPAHLRNFKVLKHSTGMLSIDNAGIYRVKQYLGHKSLQSTGAYLEVDDQQASERVQSALSSAV